MSTEFLPEELAAFQQYLLETDGQKIAAELHTRWKTGMGVPAPPVALAERSYTDLLSEFYDASEIADLSKDKLLEAHHMAMERIERGWNPAWGYQSFSELAISANAPVYERGSSGMPEANGKRKTLTRSILSELTDRVASFSPNIKRERSARGYQALLASVIFYWFLLPAKQATRFESQDSEVRKLSILGYFFWGKIQRRNAVKHPLERHPNFLSNLLTRCSLGRDELDYRIILHPEALALSGMHEHQDYTDNSVEALAQIQDTHLLLDSRPENCPEGTKLGNLWTDMRSRIAFPMPGEDPPVMVWYDFEEAALTHEELASVLCSRSIIKGWKLRNDEPPLQPEEKDTRVDDLFPERAA